MHKKLEDIQRPKYCPKCKAAYRYVSLGVFECPECGYLDKDEYARVREYLEENGAASAVQISSATGITIARINQLLRDGRLEIPNESPIFIKCEQCGTDIRYGRYCPACAAKLAGQLQGAYLSSVGETPNRPVEKMRFLDRDKKDDSRKRR